MAVISRAIKGRVPHVLKAERAYQEGLPKEQQGAYRPTKFWLRPPTPEEAAQLRDGNLNAMPHQSSLRAVRACLEKVENLRRADGEELELEKAPGVDITSHLRTAWVLELAQELDRLGDPSAEDFV